MIENQQKQPHIKTDTQRFETQTMKYLITVFKGLEDKLKISSSKKMLWKMT